MARGAPRARAAEVDEPGLPPCCPLGKSSRGVRRDRGRCCCALSESQVCIPALIGGPCPSWRWRVVVSRCHEALGMLAGKEMKILFILSGLSSQAAQVDGPRAPMEALWADGV